MESISKFNMHVWPSPIALSVFSWLSIKCHEDWISIPQYNIKIRTLGIELPSPNLSTLWINLWIAIQYKLVEVWVNINNQRSCRAHIIIHVYKMYQSILYLSMTCFDYWGVHKLFINYLFVWHMSKSVNDILIHSFEFAIQTIFI